MIAKKYFDQSRENIQRLLDRTKCIVLLDMTFNKIKVKIKQKDRKTSGRKCTTLKKMRAKTKFGKIHGIKKRIR